MENYEKLSLIKVHKNFFFISYRSEVFKFCDKVVNLEDEKVINIKLNNL